MRIRLIAIVAAGLAAAGCAAGSGDTGGTPATQTAAAALKTMPRPMSGRAAGLQTSSAANDVVQPYPPAGSCRPAGSAPYARPDPRCTPGALNPAVTQADIGDTICRRGWTAGVRPPVRITRQEKRLSMAAYGEKGPSSAYEFDHLVPLELGGATNSPLNLWPQPGASPNPKDAVEDALRAAVCAGRLTLARAQRQIAANWVALAHRVAAGTLGQ